LGDCWTYDTGKQQILRNNGNPQRYGEYCSVGDTIGCSVDLDSKAIHYYKNGKDLGQAFSDASCLSGNLFALIGLTKKTKVLVNFGKDKFTGITSDDFGTLHCFLTEKELDQLFKLFITYKDIGNKALIQEKKIKQN